jgi:putative ABC transport system permease protein
VTDMLSQFKFYVRHSLNDLRTNGQRTTFALLCIAAGVAAIVSLQTLGVMIQDTLTGSLQESNGGDIQLNVVRKQDVPAEMIRAAREAGFIESAGAGLFGGGGEEQASNFFTALGLAQVQTWFDRYYPGTVITYRKVIPGGHGPMSPTSVSDLRTETEQLFVAPYIVDAQVYPLYGTRESEAGQPLSELLNAPTNIVINRDLADTLDAQIGDTLRLSGANADFTLRGIVPNDAEGGLKNIGASMFGYFFVDQSAAGFFEDPAPGIDRIFVKLPEFASLDSVVQGIDGQFPVIDAQSTADLQKENTEVSDTLNQLVTVMGLVSLLIGGIGIINTMQVVVRRRTGEIAVLKTIGLDGAQITVLFLVEAALMGIVGSLVGVVLGWAAAYIVKGFAETFVAESLAFRITLTPALTGLVVGGILTAVFGFMPTLAAGQVRPSLVLRPNETVMPKAGRLRSLAALLVTLVVLSLIAQTLLGDLLNAVMFRLIAGGVGAVLGLLVGFPAVFMRRPRHPAWIGLIPLGFGFGYGVPALLLLAATFVIVGVLYVVLWSLIGLVGRFFPAWRWVDLKVALRAMVAARGRGASTLLALVIGVFTLSLITMLAGAVSNRFEQMLSDEAGGNVIIFASGQAGTLDSISARLDGIDGVNSYTALGTYSVDLITLQDASTGETLSFDDLKARVDSKLSPQGFMGHQRGDRLTEAMSNIDARSVYTNLPDVKFYRGRQLTAADAGQPYIVISADDTTLAAGFDVGDKLAFRFTGDSGLIDMTFEIVGMVDRTGNRMEAGPTSPNYAPIDVLPAGLSPDRVNAIVDIDKDQIPALKRSMKDVPGAFVMETRLINDLLNRFIRQFTSFPILVASLALIVGGIVIANSVALSTLERRREIGIMKAVGLQRGRVLGMLLLENGVMGLIGGLIGVGIGSVVLIILITSMFGSPLQGVIPYLTALQLMTLCVGIALLAAMLSAWGASGEKPLNVLRYE